MPELRSRLWFHKIDHILFDTKPWQGSDHACLPISVFIVGVDLEYPAMYVIAPIKGDVMMSAEVRELGPSVSHCPVECLSTVVSHSFVVCLYLSSRPPSWSARSASRYV